MKSTTLFTNTWTFTFNSQFENNPEGTNYKMQVHLYLHLQNYN